MAQPPLQRSADPAAPAGRIAPALVAAWIGLVAYVIVFFRAPLADEPPSGPFSRLGYFWASLLTPDDLLQTWFSGVTWESLAQRGLILSVAAVKQI